VETEPPDPEEEDRDRQPAGIDPVWNHWTDLAALRSLLPPYLPYDSEACRAGGRMHHKPACEVDHAKLGEPSTGVPDPGCRQRPDDHEVNDRIDGEGGKLHLV